MKAIKNIIITLIMMLLVPNLVYAATLTIEDKSYDEKTYVLEVNGSSTYSEVMVSLFDGDDLLSFKTVTTNNNKYHVTFNIEFDKDKEITIKVGDINSTNYKISKLNVKKSEPREEENSSNKLVDHDGNSLTVLDKLYKFDEEDELLIRMEFVSDELDDEDKAQIEAIEKALGRNKKVVGAIFVYVLNGEEPIKLKDVTDGYKLFLNADKEDLDGLNNPNMVRVLDEENLKFGDAIKLSYDDKDSGIVAKLDNVGMFILYDDNNIYYDFLDNTGNQTYYVKDNEDLVLKIDADLDKFIDIYIDDELVDSKNYTTKSGSTIITLKKDYVKSLPKGTHKIVVNFEDGVAQTNLNITSSNPKTGDSILIYTVLFLISSIGMIIGNIYLRKQRSL